MVLAHIRMRYIRYILLSIALISIGCHAATKTDVLVIGGSTSGVAAGIQSARLGAKTIIVEETPWVGGMLTSAGVSAVDGNYNLRSGIWGEFLDSLAIHYGGLSALKTGWVSNVLFEPSVGNGIFKKMIAAESNLTLLNGYKVRSLSKKGKTWNVEITDNDGNIRKIKSKILIDATELGDIAKLAGATYDIGMESRKSTGEDIAPESGNGIIQDLTYTAILKDYGKDVTIPQPADYNPADFACCCDNPLCINPKEPNRIWSKDMMISYGKLPNGKFMINWPIEGNDFYSNMIEMSDENRAKEIEKAKNHTLCFIYFIQKELGMNTLSLADDEFPTADKLPLIPYHRESRRIHGIVRFNLNDICKPYDQEYKLYRTTIAVGDYPVDQHHTRYTGYDSLPDLHYHAVPSYGLPLGTLFPKDVPGLIVAEKSISVTNIVNGTTRLQPVVLQIGQAAGATAALAVKANTDPTNVPVRLVQDEMLKAGGYLLPYLDVPKESPLFKPLQRIGATGILKGVGRTKDWSNQTWLRADTVLIANELSGLVDCYPKCANRLELADKALTIKQATDLLEYIADTENINRKITSREWSELGLTEYNPTRPITRGEMAVIIDYILDPFHNLQVDIFGNFLTNNKTK